MHEEASITKIKNDTNNPQFYQAVEFYYDVRMAKDPSTWPPFIFDVFDSDSGLFDHKDDFLGRAVLFHNEC